MNLNYLKQARDTHYHPYDHMAAFCSYGPHSPIYIFRYDIDSKFPNQDDNCCFRIKTFNFSKKEAAKYLTEGKIQSLGTTMTKNTMPIIRVNQAMDLPNLVTDDLISLQDRLVLF